MGQIAITNSEGVKAFIEAQEEARQQACANFIASSAALRVAPDALGLLDFDGLEQDFDEFHIRICRVLLISTILSVNLNIVDRVLKSTLLASNRFIVASRKLNERSFSAANAAINVLSGGFTTAPHAAQMAVANGQTTMFRYYENAVNADSVWVEVSRDVAVWLDHTDQVEGTLPIDVEPLWSVENPLEHRWQDVREKLLGANTPDDRSADWSFWIRWYDDILAGNLQNWDMLHEIATTPDIDREASSRKVNNKINRIVEAYALKNSYYFERIEFSEANQKLIFVPEGSFDGAIVQMAYQRLRDAIEDVRDATKEGNLDPKYALRDEIRILERTLDRTTTQPIFVVEKCFDCVKRIQARLEYATIFGHDVEDFQKALDR